MESRFFSFHSFIFFNLEALHLFSVPSALFSSPATFSAETLTRQKVVFNLPYVSSLQPLLLRALNSPGYLCFFVFFSWREMSQEANKICAPVQKALVRDRLRRPKPAALRFCLADCGLGNFSESFA